MMLSSPLCTLLLSSAVAFAAPSPSATSTSSGWDPNAVSRLPTPASPDPAAGSFFVDTVSQATQAQAAAQAAISGTSLNKRLLGLLGLGGCVGTLPVGNYLPKSAWPKFDQASGLLSFLGLSVPPGANPPVPSGYISVFNNTNTVIRSDMPGLIAIKSYSAYNASACAAECNANTLCQSFDIWMERTPSIQPSASCPLPDAAYWVKCAYYGSQITAQDATDSGKASLFKFVRSKARSCGYNKANGQPPTPPGYTEYTVPGAFQAQSIDYTNNFGRNPLVSTPAPMNGAINITICAANCKYANDYYLAGKPQGEPCNMFNLFTLAINGTQVAWQCQYWVTPFPADRATNIGGYNLDNQFVAVSNSWAYALDPQITFVPY